MHFLPQSSVPWCIGVWMSMLLTDTTPPCFSFTVMSSREGKLSVTERVHTAFWSSAHWNRGLTAKTSCRQQAASGSGGNVFLGNLLKKSIHSYFFSCCTLKKKITCTFSIMTENPLSAQSLASRYWQRPVKVKNLLSKVLKWDWPTTKHSPTHRNNHKTWTTQVFFFPAYK